MYDDIATLVAYGESTFDDYGNEDIVTTTRDVYVMPRSVYQQEFYNAAQAGFKPTITFVLSNREDYNGEQVVKYHDRFYTIVRTDWNSQRDPISLICEERVNNG